MKNSIPIRTLNLDFMEETYPISTFCLNETAKINILKSHALLLEKLSAV